MVGKPAAYRRSLPPWIPTLGKPEKQHQQTTAFQCCFFWQKLCVAYLRLSVRWDGRKPENVGGGRAEYGGGKPLLSFPDPARILPAFLIVTTDWEPGTGWSCLQWLAQASFSQPQWRCCLLSQSDATLICNIQSNFTCIHYSLHVFTPASSMYTTPVNEHFEYAVVTSSSCTFLVCSIDITHSLLTEVYGLYISHNDTTGCRLKLNLVSTRYWTG